MLFSVLNASRCKCFVSFPLSLRSSVSYERHTSYSSCLVIFLYYWGILFQRKMLPLFVLCFSLLLVRSFISNERHYCYCFVSFTLFLRSSVSTWTFSRKPISMKPSELKTNFSRKLYVIFWSLFVYRFQRKILLLQTLAQYFRRRKYQVFFLLWDALQPQVVHPISFRCNKPTATLVWDCGL